MEEEASSSSGTGFVGELGDVIVEANGKPVRRLSDLTDEIEQLGAGRTVRLVSTKQIGRPRRPIKPKVGIN